ncbi:MAG: Stk1 family PASTA domain-containing Ser/Thr kinase [Ruminococcus sp.]|nr:Stk1 family PASTA domain-containing Ser/Thr kinase [Ruminococcus sp.]
MDSNIGKKLDGRYEITELIGVGGMADVYKAMDVMENRTVAVKILKPEFAENEEFLRRFRNESKAIAVLSHPNIVKIYDVGFTDEIQFIVMEYIDGITLKEFIERQGVLKWKDALHFVTQILRALQHAHDKGIVHRDIKPQNIMLFTDGTIKVMDFGIARFSRIDGKTLSDKTIGSVHYISPEQARGDMTDERSDIYSVGVMLYEMLTGRKPFDGENPVAIALKHMQEDAVPPREIMPAIPEALEEIVIHAMEREPVRRYQSAAEMIRDIDTFKLNQSVVFGYKDGAAVASSQLFDAPVNNQPPIYDDYDENYEDDSDEEDDETDEDEEEDGKKRSYVVPILLAVTVAVVIVAACVIGWVVIKSFSGTSGIHTGTVTLPNFVGKNIVQVEQDWKDKLKFELVNEYNDEYDDGIIFWQSQTAGKSVKEGYTLTLKVSKGKQMVIIPDMTGNEQAVAESELKAAMFNVVLRTMFDDEVAEGLVIKTEPPAGSEYAYGGTVTIFVSKGPVDTQVKVPDVVGMTKEKAIAALKENKLVAKVEEIEHEGDKGKVIDQSIDAGDKVDMETEVTIYVSTGETEPVDLTISLPLPNGIHGAYSIEVYKNGNVAYSQSISRGETVAGGTVNIDISGKKTETLTISIRNEETGKTINYAVYDIDYDKKEVKLNGSLNESGLIDITPTTTESTTTTTTTTTEEPPAPPVTEPEPSSQPDPNGTVNDNPSA